ncbi:MAG: hypothetical protein R3E68_00805 [Burkholderiaceae bacterium]
MRDRVSRVLVKSTRPLTLTAAHADRSIDAYNGLYGANPAIAGYKRSTDTTTPLAARLTRRWTRTAASRPAWATRPTAGLGRFAYDEDDGSSPFYTDDVRAQWFSTGCALPAPVVRRKYPVAGRACARRS